MINLEAEVTDPNHIKFVVQGFDGDNYDIKNAKSYDDLASARKAFDRMVKKTRNLAPGDKGFYTKVYIDECEWGIIRKEHDVWTRRGWNAPEGDGVQVRVQYVGCTQFHEAVIWFQMAYGTPAPDGEWDFEYGFSMDRLRELTESLNTIYKHCERMDAAREAGEVQEVGES